MFDRLIVTEPAGANLRSRKNYFLVSALTVGALALTAVVVSIFAGDVNLGTDTFELSVIVMPVDPPATQPEAPRPKAPAQQNPASTSSQVPTRQINMSRVDEPTVVPKSTSTAPNAQLSRPARFDIGRLDTEPGSGSGPTRSSGPGGDGLDGVLTAARQAAETTPDEPPPPVRTAPRVPPVVSRGVINGQALSLPKPPYPAAALAVRAEGKVDVQVLIDETGRVVSARAVSGNALLRDAAERAAHMARFSPTKLSDVPVKVTGVIVYNFTHG